MAFDIQGALKEGYSKAEIADHLASQSKFDIGAARKEGYNDDEILNHLGAGQKPKGRTWGEFGKDVALSAVQGLDTLAKLPAMAYDKATTGDWYGPETQKISAMSDEREKLKSAESQAKNKDKAAKAQAAGEAAREYVGDGALGTASQVATEFGSSFWESLKDPSSIPEFVAQQLAQLGVMGKVGKGAEIAAHTAAKAAPRLAATKAGQAALANSGTAGAVGFGAGLQGVDVGSDTMQRLMALPDELWAQNPEFVTLAAEIGAAAAKQEISAQLAGQATLKAGAVSLATAAMPGGTSIERALIGKHKGGFKTVPKAFAGEAGQEGAEEGSGKYFGNTAVQEVNPNQDAWEGVGAAAGQGAYMGGVMGGGLHAGRVLTDNRSAPITADVTADGRIETAQPGTSNNDQPGDAELLVALQQATADQAQPPPGAAPMQEAQQAQDVATEAQPVPAMQAASTPSSKHPTEQAADAIVAQAAQEAGIPLEIVLPLSSTAQQATPLPKAGAPQPVIQSAPQSGGGADAFAQQPDTLVQQDEIPSMAAPAPDNEARAAQLWIKAGDGTITPNEQAELTSLQQAMNAETTAAPAIGPVAQPAADPAIAQAPVGNSVEPQPDAAGQQAGDVQPPAAVTPPRTEKEARALRAMQGAQPQEISNGPQAAQAQQAEAQGSERQQAPAPAAEQVAPKTEREAREQRRQTDILTPDGKKVAAQWDVVEADSIKASLKEGVSQPRDRTRAASNAQVLEIAGNPDFERLSDTSKTMDYGAPTLSADGLIVGGNGRFEGISRAYDGPTATAYRAAVEQQAARFGLDGDAIRGMKKPVLVRRITDNADTRQLAIQSNQAAGLQMSDMEQAALDAERMKSLDQIEIMQAIQQTLAGYATNELAGMMTADGGLSQSGMRRLRNAILFSAYGKSETLARLIESPDADMKNVGTALVRAAGKLSKVRGGVADGSIPAEFDIAGDLTAAIETLSAIRAEGKRLDEFLAQGDMFGGGVTDAQKTIMQVLADNLRSAKNITAFLQDYAQQVASIQNSKGGLFGDAPLPTKQEVLDRARKPYQPDDGRANSAQDLFNSTTPELHADTTGGNREVQAGESGNRPDARGQSGDEAARKPESGTGADAGSAKPAGINYADDFAIRPVEITEHLISTGNIKALYKAAGVKTADAFGGLSMDQRSKAYAQYVENGGQPAPPATEAYNDKVARMEREALIRRLQSDATVRQASGKPFKTEASAKEFSTRHELDDTHEVSKVEAGYVLKRLPEARRPSVLKALAERQANDPENQRQERAFSRAGKIGAAASDAVTAYENGDTSIEQFEAALDAAEKVGAGRTAQKLEEPSDKDYTDPYEHTETRPGTTDAQREAGRSALADLARRIGLGSLGKRNRADRVSPTVLGARLVANFVAGRPNQLVGQVAKTPADLAAIAQVYRDPRFETFRAVYLVGNKIVGELGYTSRLPGAVVLPQDLDAKIAHGMAKFEADGFYILHNHPSGSARPSASDVRLTTDIAAFVQGFRGHVVIDHNEYAVIAKDFINGEMRNEVIQDDSLNGTDFTGNPAVSHKLLGTELSNPRAVAGLAKELQTPQGHATLVLTARNGETQLIVDVPMGALNDTSRQGILKGKALIRRMARDSGSGGNRFIILPDGVDVKTLGMWAREGVFTDVVSADGVSFREVSAAPVKPDFIDNGRAMEVREDSAQKDGYANALFSRTPANGNDAVSAVVVDDVTANGIIARFVAAFPGIKGKIHVVPDFAALPANVQQDARDQGSGEKDTKGALDHQTGSVFIVQGNHTSATDFEETVFHEALGHVGMRTLLGRGFVQELNNLYGQFGGLEGLAKIARARGFDKQFGEYVRGVAKARGQNDKFTLAIAKAVLSEEVFAHAAEQRPKLLDRLKALVGMLRQNLRDLGFKGLAQYGETDLLWLLQRAKVKLQTGKADGRGGWTVLKSAYGNGNGGNNSLGLAGGAPANPKPALPDETLRRKIQRLGQDKLNRFTVIKEWLAEQGVKLSELADVYKAEERMHSRFANKAEDFREKTIKPLVEKIQKAGFDMDQVAEFLHAQHAQERNVQVAKVNQDRPDGGSGMTNAEAQKILAAASPELKKLANEFRAITDRTLQVLLDAGIIDKERAAAYRAAYQHYVPLKGGPDDGKTPGTGKGLTTRYKGKRALGHGEREGGEWIIENIIADHERAIMLAEKNLVGKHLLHMAMEIGREDLLTIDKPKKRQVLKNDVGYEVLHRGQVIGTFDSQDAANQFKARAMGMYKSTTPSAFTIRKTSDQHVVLMASPMIDPANETVVYVAGHEVRVQIKDEILARAFNNMGVEAMGAIMRVGAGLNAYFSKIYTGYNPEFILTNILRDFTTGLANITGEEGIVMAGKAAKNYPARFIELFRYAWTNKETKWVKMYREDGGNTGAAYLSDIERLGKEVQTEYAAYQGVTANLKAGDYKSAARAAGRKVFDRSIVFIEHLNKAGENAMRLSVYQAMIESGKSRNEAASMAKNVTVNFNRKGEWGQQANAMYLFFNAGVQGTAALAHAHAKGKHRKQAWAFSGTLMGLGYLLSLAAAGGDEDDYEKVSEYERSRNLLIKTGDGYAKIPLPYGYGFFWNMGRGFADAQRTGDFSMSKMGWHVAASFVEEFTPFGSMVAGKEADLGQAMLYATPTVFQIPGAVAFNKSSMGGLLIPDNKFDEHQPDREKMNRATRGTLADDLAGALEAAGLDVSPETIKHLSRTFTGGAGSFSMAVWDGAKLTWQGAEIEAKEIPFARKFYTVPDVRGARARYHEAKNEADKAMSELNRARKAADDSKVGQIVDEQYEMLRMAKLADGWSKMTKAQRDRADAIRLSGTYTKAEERAIIKQMEREEIEMYDDFMAQFKGAKKEMRERAGQQVR